ncbi:MAG TPA: hypothetical protein ENG85_01870 [Bacteroidetes bacterium]|nr:hypothetical protein [Bacteroidota bacterium]
MNNKDRTQIQVLAKEGKPISKIMEFDFPEYDYWEIYEAVHDAGGRSALGVKRTIANRLKTLSETRKKNERDEIIEEIEELVWHLYDGLKISQKKLSAIRKALEK